MHKYKVITEAIIATNLRVTLPENEGKSAVKIPRRPIIPIFKVKGSIFGSVVEKPAARRPSKLHTK